MAHASSISVKSLQAAVHAAVHEHPKFNVEVPHEVTTFHLIRGFPIPEILAATVTLGEAQAFANSVASHIVAAHPEAVHSAAAHAAHAPASHGVVLSTGGHIICGIPPFNEI